MIVEQGRIGEERSPSETPHEEKSFRARLESAFLEGESGDLNRLIRELPRNKAEDNEGRWNEVLLCLMDLIRRGELPTSLEADLAIQFYLNDVHMISPDVLYDACVELEALSVGEYSEGAERAFVQQFRTRLTGWVGYETEWMGARIIPFLQKNLARGIAAEDPTRIHRLVSFACKVGCDATATGMGTNGPYQILNLTEEVLAETDNYFLTRQIELEQARLKEGIAYELVDEPEDFEAITASTPPRLLSSVNLEAQTPHVEVKVGQIADGYLGQYDRYGDLLGFTHETNAEHIHLVREMPVFLDTDDSPIADRAMREDYLFLAKPNFRQLINQDFGIVIEALSFPVQNFFLNRLKTMTWDEANRWSTLSKRFGADFLAVTVAATDLDQEEAIINFCETADAEEVQVILSQYASLEREAERAVSYTADLSPLGPDSSHRLGQRITSLLFGRAVGVLKEGIANPEVASAAVHRGQAEIQLLGLTIKEMTRTNLPFRLEDLPDITVENYQGGALSEEKAAELMAISEANWQSKPHIAEAVTDSLRQSLAQSSTRIHVVERLGRPVAFFRMDETGPEERYFGSVNIAPEAQGYALAPALMQQLFLKEAEGNLVTAHTIPWDKVTEQYIGDSGFVSTGMVDYGGQAVLHIERDGRLGHEPQGKAYGGLSFQELVQHASDAEGSIQLYTFKPDNDQFLNDVQQRVSNGNEVITNVRYGPRNQDGSLPVAVAYEPKLVPTAEPVLQLTK